MLRVPTLGVGSAAGSSKQRVKLEGDQTGGVATAWARGISNDEDGWSRIGAMQVRPVSPPGKPPILQGSGGLQELGWDSKLGKSRFISKHRPDAGSGVLVESH